MPPDPLAWVCLCMHHHWYPPNLEYLLLPLAQLRNSASFTRLFLARRHTWAGHKTRPDEDFLIKEFFQFTTVCLQSCWVPVLGVSSSLSATATLF